MATSTLAPEDVQAGHGAAEDRAAPLPRRSAGRLRRRVVMLVALPLLSLGLTACMPTPAQEQVRAAVNQSRSAHGLHGLRDELIVREKAQAWAEHLARKGSLSHSRLSDGLGLLPWTAVAENVGYGGSAAAVHEQFMRSPGHRANILDRRWDVIGTGHAVAADGRVFVVHVFVALP